MPTLTNIDITFTSNDSPCIILKRAIEKFIQEGTSDNDNENESFILCMIRFMLEGSRKQQIREYDVRRCYKTYLYKYHPDRIRTYHDQIIDIFPEIFKSTD